MMKILLVEDDKMLIQMYLDEFMEEGFEVTSVNDGKAGLIEAVKLKPDFILLDIMMPGMDGVTLFKHLKDTPQTKDIPVAFLTVVPEGVPESLNKNPDLLKGAVGYWRKDKYSPIQVVQLIKKYLQVNPA